MSNKKTVDTKAQVLEDRLSEVSDEILELLYEEAKGSYFALSPYNKRSPKDSDLISEEAAVVRKECRVCRRPFFKEPVEIWQVWKKRPDTGALKYLYDHVVGKAKQKAQEEVDPEIIVVFGDIDTVGSGATSKSIANEMQGSPNRTPNKSRELDKKLGIDDIDKDLII